VEKINSDQPLEDEEKDLLNYSEFAVNISNTILEDLPDEAFVLGINGSWGSGKTTILNFLEEDLTDKSSSTVVRFNPWWFSGEKDLISKFFEHLMSELNGDKFDNLKEDLRRFSSAVSKVPISKFTGMPVEHIAKGVKSTLEEPNIPELKNSIEEALSELDSPIVVMVDDIDRLTDKEIRQIFKLVKSVADFPNVVYVLSYDRKVVVEALDKEKGQSGEEYLSKIVQLPIRIPSSNDRHLREMFLERLDRVVEGDPIFEQERFHKLMRYGVSNKIETPRDVVRLTNSVAVSSNILGGEVNLVDLIGLETLKIFDAETYQTIRDDIGHFIDSRKLDLRSNTESDFSEILEEIDDSSANILSLLFPKFS
jgi:predicted KAP-like P-loop ATPase